MKKFTKKITKKFNILPEISDIIYFKKAEKKAGKKEKNDKDNKIRENVIYNIFNIDEDYFNDPTYGSEWKIFHEKLTQTIKKFCELPFSSIDIKHLGGRTKNYDFMISFMDENNNIIKNVKTEFKHNNSNVSKLPQFLEITAKEFKYKYEVSEIPYDEFYYDNYLDSYLKIDDELTLPKPSKEYYLKNVYIYESPHEFFKLLYNKKNNKLKEKRKIVNESEKVYLEVYLHTFKFDKIIEKIKESQMNKMFLLWDCNNFHTEELDIKDMKITGIKKISDLDFDLGTENFKYDINIRLNWGNNNGITNPRWKFGFIQKK
jgi:hypothetical protein